MTTEKQTAPSDVMLGYLLVALFCGAIGGVLIGVGGLGDDSPAVLAGYVLAGLAGLFLWIWTIALGVMLGLRAHAREQA